MGSPRSGTTWLAKILDTYPGVLYLHEPLAKLEDPALKPIIERLVATGSLPPNEIADLLRGLDCVHHECCRPPFFPKSFQRVPAWVMALAWTTAGATRAGRDAFARYCSPDPAVPHDLLIKEVDWLGHVPNVIGGLNPDFVLFIIRYPCAVVNSRLRGLRMGLNYGHDRSRWLERNGEQCDAFGFSHPQVRQMPAWEFYALDWLLENTCYRRMARSRPGTMTVVYHDLCLDPGNVAADIFSFLGWPATPRTERFIRASTHSPLRSIMMKLAGGRRSYYNLYRDPMHALSAWRHELTTKQKQAILDICKPFPDMAVLNTAEDAEYTDTGSKSRLFCLHST